MPVAEPYWWYAAHRGVASRLLAPAGWMVDTLAQWRWRRASGYRSSLPVICIGNFTAGGNGKTPFALAVAEMLQDRGEHPVFLSRGYGGTERGPHRVVGRADPATRVGDEPLLLAAVAPTYVARDRAGGARLIEQDAAAGKLTASVIVMDDGLQNPGLQKDLSFALIDCRRGLGNGAVIPAGPLRAALDFQAKLVDCVVVTGDGADSDAGAIAARALEKPLVRARIEAADISWLRGRSVVAFAGIANPDRFFSLLVQAGARIEARYAFADHEVVSSSQAAGILAAAAAHNGIVVTTAKDHVRLTGTGDSMALRNLAHIVPIQVALSAADKAALQQLLAAVLARKSITR